MPTVDLAEITRVVVSPNGEIAGYYEVWDLTPHTNVNVWGRVHPGHRGLGIGSYLLNWADQRSLLAVDKAPSGSRVVSRGWVLTKNQLARQLFEAAGYNLIRYNYRMVINLDGPPVEPIWPDGIQIRSAVRDQGEREIYSAVDEAFRDHWGHVERPFEENFQFWLSFWKNDTFDPSLWRIAMDGEHIVGFSLCLDHLYEDEGMGWVATLGVRRPWRKRGLGMALLQDSFGELYRRGRRKVGLGVDAQNLTGAVRLYEKAGMHSDPERQYSVFEKELRPGIDLSIQSLDG
jgi:mycothiol synthase